MLLQLFLFFAWKYAKNIGCFFNSTALSPFENLVRVAHLPFENQTEFNSFIRILCTHFG